MLMIKRISVLALVAVTLWGCAAPQNNTQKGALYGTGIGAAVGAGLGQVIGGDTQSTLIGAGIGAALGGVAGGSIGRYMDNQLFVSSLLQVRRLMFNAMPIFWRLPSKAMSFLMLTHQR